MCTAQNGSPKAEIRKKPEPRNPQAPAVLSAFGFRPSFGLRPFANSWHHFVGTWDSATGLRKLYVDGVLSDWLGSDYGPLPQPAYDYLTIGGEDSCNGTPNNGVTVPTIDNSCFRGAFCDVRVYNYALTAIEVPNVMNPNVTTALRAAADTPVIDQGYTGTFGLTINHQTGQYTATDTPGASPKFYRLMINE